MTYSFSARQRAAFGPLMTLVAALVGMTALTLWRIGALSVWLDEAVSIYSARVSWWPLVEALETDSVRYSSFYYLLLSGWSHTGTSEARLRALSVLFALAAVVIVFVLVRRYFGNRTAGLAAALLAANSLMVEFAREIRPYTLLALMSVASTLAFTAVVERRSRGSWFVWALITGLGAYVHWFMGYVVAAQLISLLFVPDLRARFKPLVLGLVTMGALGAPLLLVMASSGAPGTDWIKSPALTDIPMMLVALAGGIHVVAGACLVAASVGLIRGRPVGDDLGRWPVALVTLWATLPLVGSFVASQVVPMFLDRYLIIVTPAVAILAAIGISSLRRRLSVVLAAALVVASVGGALVNQLSVQHEDWRGATAFVLAQNRPEDGIVFYSGATRQPFEYYVERRAATAPTPIYPPGPWSTGRPLAGRHAASPADAVERATCASRMWLVLSHAPDSADRAALADAIEQRYQLVSQKTFAGWVVVRLYEARGPEL